MLPEATVFWDGHGSSRQLAAMEILSLVAVLQVFRPYESGICGHFLPPASVHTLDFRLLGQLWLASAV